MAENEKKQRPKRPNYLDPKVVSKIKNLNLVSRLIVEGFVSGLHKSPFKGFSTEFAEHRQYFPGDDLKYLDWKVYGRSEKWYIKQFEEETNLKTYVVLDTSASMGFPEKKKPNKLEYAKHLTAALAFLLIKQRDAVGLVQGDSDIQRFIPARNAMGHFEVINRILTQIKASGEGAFYRPLHLAAERIKGRGLIVVISDLFDGNDELIEALRHLHYKRHDVIVFHLLDKAELDFPFDEEIDFVDMESRKHVKVNARLMAADYKKRLEAFISFFKEACRKNQLDYRLMHTGQSYGTALQSYLASRQGKS